MPPKKTAAKPAAKPAAKKASTSKGAAAKVEKAAEPPKAEAPEMGTSIILKDLNKTLFTPEGEVAKSGRWALLTDPSENSATFLRYRDCNNLNAINKEDMMPERIRAAVLGSVRFGKPLVIDFMQTDMNETWPKVVESFDLAHKGLMEMIMGRVITREDIYEKLIRDHDDQAIYAKHFFDDKTTNNFSFVAVSANPDAPKEFRKMFFVVNIE